MYTWGWVQTSHIHNIVLSPLLTPCMMFGDKSYTIGGVAKINQHRRCWHWLLHVEFTEKLRAWNASQRVLRVLNTNCLRRGQSCRNMPKSYPRSPIILPSFHPFGLRRFYPTVYPSLCRQLIPADPTSSASAREMLLAAHVQPNDDKMTSRVYMVSLAVSGDDVPALGTRRQTTL